MIRIFLLIILFFFPVWGLEVVSKEGSLPEAQLGLFLLSHDREAKTDAASYRATATGGYMAYRTRSVGGVFLDFKLLSVNPVEVQENSGASLLFDEEGKSIDSLIGAYVGMREGSNLLKIGRHELNTPLLNGDGTLLLPYAYKGWSYLWDNRDGNKITLGQVDALKAPDARFFSGFSPGGDISRGVSYLGFEEQGESGLGARLYLYRGEALYDAFFLEATDTYPVGAATVLSGVQYVKTAKNGQGTAMDFSRKEGGDDVELMAARLGFKYDIVGLLVAYSVNNGDDGLGRAYGGYADLFTTTMITDMPSYGGPATTSVRFKFDWFDNASTRLIYNTVAYREKFHPEIPSNMTDDYTSRYGDLRIEFKEGATLYFQYEAVEKETVGSDLTEFRASFIQRF